MENLRKIRIKLHRSQSFIAKQLGTSVQTISNWERGNTEPDLNSLKQLAKILKTTIDYLLNFTTQNS